MAIIVTTWSGDKIRNNVRKKMYDVKILNAYHHGTNIWLVLRRIAVLVKVNVQCASIIFDRILDFLFCIENTSRIAVHLDFILNTIINLSFIFLNTLFIPPKNDFDNALFRSIILEISLLGIAVFSFFFSR